MGALGEDGMQWHLALALLERLRLAADDELQELEKIATERLSNAAKGKGKSKGKQKS